MKISAKIKTMKLATSNALPVVLVSKMTQNQMIPIKVTPINPAIRFEKPSLMFVGNLVLFRRSEFGNSNGFFLSIVRFDVPFV